MSVHEAPGSSRAAGSGGVAPHRVHGTQPAAGSAGFRLCRPGSRRGRFCSGGSGPVKPERGVERMRRAATGIVAAGLGAGRVYAV